MSEETSPSQASSASNAPNAYREAEAAAPHTTHEASTAPVTSAGGSNQRAGGVALVQQVELAGPREKAGQQAEDDIVPPASWVRFWRGLPDVARDWLGDPDMSIFFVVFMLLAVALYMRPLTGASGYSGFVFDEQEAIIANPYVRGSQTWLEAFNRDFWGLKATHTIGSYRPLPDLLWRLLWRAQQLRGGMPGNLPFVWFNIFFHATNAAILASIVRHALQRVGAAWLAGGLFCCAAILTEAVTGIVGIADVLGGLSLLLAIVALARPRIGALFPLYVAFATFAATLFGLLSKESAIVNVGLVPLIALFAARLIDREKPQRWMRFAMSGFGTVSALVAYVYIRHRTYHVELTPDASAKGLGKLADFVRVYIGAPNLPVDPFNNPLAEPKAAYAQQVAGALRVYFRGLMQVLAPRNLSPDYSMPQEPLPPSMPKFWPHGEQVAIAYNNITQLMSWETVLGGLLLVVPPLVGVLLALNASLRSGGEDKTQRRREQTLLALGLMCWPAAIFPMSNIPKLLPTVRAERLWYVPALFIAIALMVAVLWIARRRFAIAAALCTVYFGFQVAQARRHANDFRDDLAFWRAAAEHVPRSAKAHLNYSVMLGARAPELWKWTTTQAQEARLKENIIATQLAPQWDMAFIYVGDTLCQLNRLDEAWAWYVRGFRIGPQNSGLVALALQCMSDHNQLLAHEAEALALMEEPGMSNSWYAVIARDTLERERKCRGRDKSAEAVRDTELMPHELDPQPDQVNPSEGYEPDDSDAEPSVSTSASASLAPRGSTSASASLAPRGSTSASASLAPHGSSSASASTSASEGEAAPKPASKPAVALPPCGVDPQYRPRSLDGDPKGE